MIGCDGHVRFSLGVVVRILRWTRQCRQPVKLRKMASLTGRPIAKVRMPGPPSVGCESVAHGTWWQARGGRMREASGIGSRETLRNRVGATDLGQSGADTIKELG